MSPDKVSVTKVQSVRKREDGRSANETKIGPHTIATFLFLEQHKTVYRSLKGIKNNEPTVV